jgi:DegT/DnrJ/EryC1/StrS aminotransferase family
MSTSTVPFVDLRAQHEEVRDQIEKAIADIIDRSSFIGGAYVSTFEREFADYQGAREVVGVANGTDAWPCLWRVSSRVRLSSPSRIRSLPRSRRLRAVAPHLCL